MIEVPLWVGGAPKTSLDRRTLTSYRGEPLATIHEAPSLLVRRVADGLRAAAAPAGERPEDRWRAIARAGELFATATLGGLSPEEHARAVTLSTGMPIRWSVAGMEELAAGLRQIESALRWQAPNGSLEAFASGRVPGPDGRPFAWVPVGRVLGVVESSNHPAVQQAWVQALAFGWSVLVRPGADDPFTPWRLVAALGEAGFPVDRVALLAGSHELAHALRAATDRLLAYGGDAAREAFGGDARTLFNGPGRSKVFVDGDVALEPAIDFVLDCAAHAAGRKCLCASAVVTRGAPAGLVDGVRARLAALPLVDPLDPDARVPAWKDAEAVPAPPARLARRDGLAFLEPDVVACPDAPAPPFARELPGIWLTAAEVAPGGDPLPLLRQTLALTLLGSDASLIESCLREPSIAKVYAGAVPTWTSVPGAPHYGRLSDFLFTSKACWVGDPPAR
jgi:acyl-CoA reductase-like NAD-dependent aldehyde dehydrogenase